MRQLLWMAHTACGYVARLPSKAVQVSGCSRAAVSLHRDIHRAINHQNRAAIPAMMPDREAVSCSIHSQRKWCRSRESLPAASVVCC